MDTEERRKRAKRTPEPRALPSVGGPDPAHLILSLLQPFLAAYRERHDQLDRIENLLEARAAELNRTRAGSAQPWSDLTYTMPLNWIPLARFCELTGYTPAAIRTKINRGQITEGRQYRHAPDGSIHMCCKGWDSWVEGRAR